jgi:hypothetical protein
METEGEKKGAEAAPETPAEPAPEEGAKEPESGDKANPESP